MSGNVDVKYDFTPYDCTPGEAYERYEQDLLNAGALRADDRGWTLAECILGIDEGGAAGPPLPAGGGAGAASAGRLRQKRLKESYALQAKHITDEDTKLSLRVNHFLNGRGAFLAVQTACQHAISRSKLKELDREWDDVSILNDAGVNEDSIFTIGKRLRAKNGRRPAASRKTEEDMGDRLLECIFNASKHFSESATKEYNAAVGARDFEHVAPHPLAGQRDFQGILNYYGELWRQAVKSRLPGFGTRDPVKRAVPATRQTLEQGLHVDERADARPPTFGCAAGQAGREAPQHRNPTHDESARVADEAYVPRPGSPSDTLIELANAGDDLAARRGTLTTTDWSMLDPVELAAAVEEHGAPGQFEVAYVFDADDAGSIELICDCCRGLGHLKRVCPSNKNRIRSLAYAIGLLQAKLEGKSPARRPPGRGQRPPFRGQPRRGAPYAGPTRFRPQGAPANRRARLFGRSAEEGDENEEDFSSNRESSHTASERPGAAAFAFTTSDDALYESERARAAIEASGRATVEAIASHAGYMTRQMGFMLVSALLVMITGIAMAYEIISRNVGYVTAIAIASVPLLWLSEPLPGRVLGARIVIIVLALLSSQLCGAMVVTEERAYSGTAVGNLRMGAIDMCVDSGCTSTSIEEGLATQLEKKLGASFITEIVDASPNRSLHIADDAALPIIKIVKAQLPVTGYKLANESKAIETVLPSSRTLIVSGMKKDSILLSTRGMKRDGINTYLNDDNSINKSDCLLIKKSGVIVPFIPSAGSYNISMSSQTESLKSGADKPGKSPKSDANESSTEAQPSSRATRPSQVRSARDAHKALGHIGERRLLDSNLTIDGQSTSKLSRAHNESSCRGCRLGTTGLNHVPHKSRNYSDGDSTRGFAHFGQQIDSDICTGFPASFPHHFSCMINFVDRYSHELYIYFLRTPNSHEVCSAGRSFQATVSHRLVDGKVGRWVADNGKMFLSEETEELAAELCRDRGFQIPNDSNSLPVPERSWGVIQRMMRCWLHEPDPPVPECLWPWAAAQASQLLYFLPTNALDPPMSPYQFSTGRSEAADLGWARTMFCDCTVTVPTRDRDGKLDSRSADACHFGYDRRRHAHFCYVPSLQRISSFTVTEWRENSWTCCQTITADTPVEFFDARDLAVSPVTSSLVPRRFTARKGTETRPLKVVGVFCGELRGDDIAHNLKGQGHSVSCYDTKIDARHDFTSQANRTALLSEIDESVDFVFLSPPCDTASIAHPCALRTLSHPYGRPDLTPTEAAKCNVANILYDFTGEIAAKCAALKVRFCIESAASRRVGPTNCKWSRFANHAFLWDYPAITSLRNDAQYLCFAQCRFNAPYQKYTGLLVDNASHAAFHRLFAHAVCECKSHAVVLKGYDDSGVARTSYAERYTPRLATTFAAAIVEACGLNQEGERGDAWSEALLTLDNRSLSAEMARSATEVGHSHTQYVGSLSLPPTSLRGTDATADITADEAPTDEDEVEIWMESAEGAYRVSEVGTIPVPKTVAEARASKWWPMFKKAMEEEIHGKLANAAWKVIKRPANEHVLKSKWVFTIKYDIDGSVKVVKARFVACGYSQMENTD